jgi:predicted transcriptional regulator of viral defense system
VRARSLSEAEARVVLGLESRGQARITLSELRRSARVSPGFARKLAHNLVRKGWLQRIRPGLYLLNPSEHGPDAIPDTDPFRVGALLASPYYFGYATAAELLGLLPQAGRVYYVVAPVRSRRIRRGNAEFRFVHTSARAIWGTRSIERRGVSLVVSDPERTVIDVVTRPELAGGLPGAARILFAAKPTLDWDRMAQYVGRAQRPSLAQRIGFLGQRVRPEFPMPTRAERAFRPRRSASYAPLGPPSVYGRRGQHDPGWRVLDNVGPARLLEEVRGG